MFARLHPDWDVRHIKGISLISKESFKVKNVEEMLRNPSQIRPRVEHHADISLFTLVVFVCSHR